MSGPRQAVGRRLGAHERARAPANDAVETRLRGPSLSLLGRTCCARVGREPCRTGLQSLRASAPFRVSARTTR